MSKYQEALEVIEGTLIGDAGLGFSHSSGNAYYGIAQVGVDHIDWLSSISSALASLGVGVCREGRPGLYTQKGRLSSRLESNTSVLLTTLHSQWYNSLGEKVIPMNLKLTPAKLANWYMGDGGSSWRNENLVYLALATHCFGKQSLECLLSNLERLGISHISSVRDKRVAGTDRGFFLSTTDSTTINILMDLIESYIMPSFRYKIKRPWLKGGKGCKAVLGKLVWREGGWVHGT